MSSSCEKNSTPSLQSIVSTLKRELHKLIPQYKKSVDTNLNMLLKEPFSGIAYQKDENGATYCIHYFARFSFNNECIEGEDKVIIVGDYYRQGEGFGAFIISSKINNYAETIKNLAQKVKINSCHWHQFFLPPFNTVETFDNIKKMFDVITIEQRSRLDTSCLSKYNKIIESAAEKYRPMLNSQAEKFLRNFGNDFDYIRSINNLPNNIKLINWYYARGKSSVEEVKFRREEFHEYPYLLTLMLSNFLPSDGEDSKIPVDFLVKDLAHWKELSSNHNIAKFINNDNYESISAVFVAVNLIFESILHKPKLLKDIDSNIAIDCLLKLSEITKNNFTKYGRISGLYSIFGFVKKKIMEDGPLIEIPYHLLLQALLYQVENILTNPTKTYLKMIFSKTEYGTTYDLDCIDFEKIIELSGKWEIEKHKVIIEYIKGNDNWGNHLFKWLKPFKKAISIDNDAIHYGTIEAINDINECGDIEIDQGSELLLLDVISERTIPFKVNNSGRVKLLLLHIDNRCKESEFNIRFSQYYKSAIDGKYHQMIESSVYTELNVNVLLWFQKKGFSLLKNRHLYGALKHPYIDVDYLLCKHPELLPDKSAIYPKETAPYPDCPF